MSFHPVTCCNHCFDFGSFTAWWVNCLHKTNPQGSPYWNYFCRYWLPSLNSTDLCYWIWMDCSFYYVLNELSLNSHFTLSHRPSNWINLCCFGWCLACGVSDWLSQSCRWSHPDSPRCWKSVSFIDNYFRVFSCKSSSLFRYQPSSLEFPHPMEHHHIENHPLYQNSRNLSLMQPTTMNRLILFRRRSITQLSFDIWPSMGAHKCPKFRFDSQHPSLAFSRSNQSSRRKFSTIFHWYVFASPTWLMNSLFFSGTYSLIHHEGFGALMIFYRVCWKEGIQIEEHAASSQVPKYQF